MKNAILRFVSLLCIFFHFVNCHKLKAQDIKIIPQFGHSFFIYSAMAISEDDQYIATATANNIIIWDLVSGIELMHLPGLQDAPEMLSFSPDGNYFAAGSGSGFVYMWSLHNNRLLWKDTLKRDEITHLQFSQDSKFLFIANKTSDIQGYETLTGTAGFRFRHEGTVQRFDIFNNRIYSGAECLYTWDIKTGTTVSKQIYQGCNHLKVLNEDSVLILGQDELYMINPNNGLTRLLRREKTFVTHFDVFRAERRYAYCSTWATPDIMYGTCSEKEAFRLITDKSLPHTLCYFHKNNYAATGHLPNKIYIWDMAGKKLLREFTANKNITFYLAGLSFSSDKNRMSCNATNQVIKLFDLQRFTQLNSKKIQLNDNSLNASILFPDGNRVLFSVSGIDKFFIWETGNQSLKSINVKPNLAYKGAYFLPSGLLITHNDNKRLLLIDLTGQKIIAQTEYEESTQNSGVLSANQETYYFKTDNKITAYRTSDLSRLFSADAVRGNILAATPDSRYLLLTTARNPEGEPDSVCCFDPVTMDVGYRFQAHDKMINSGCFSSDGKFFLTASNDKTMKLWSYPGFRLVRSYESAENKVIEAGFINNDKLIIASTNNTLQIWDAEKAVLTATLMASADNDWAIFTPDGYFDCSPGASEYIAAISGNQGYRIDQIAAKYNRPDIILDRLHCTDTLLIQHLQAVYQKRLKRMKLSENAFNRWNQLPVVGKIETQQNGKWMDLKFSLNDNSNKISSYNIYINDVPLYRSEGIRLTGDEKVITERVELTAGTNKIEVACRDDFWQESMRSPVYADYQEKRKPDLYFLGFGVSKYQNAELNLQFADKDAVDLSKVMEKLSGKGFSKVYTRVYVNEQVTRDSIVKAKEFVRNARPDDMFILFIAGHGMHERDAVATYYYLTSNADPDDLKNTAADFETIEDLLQGIPPRNKLFLMDACESGELEDEEQASFLSQAGTKGITSRGMKATTQIKGVQKEAKPKRTFLFQRDRYIYNDLVRRSGAIVFSSSKGGELSYERNDIENGLFTEYIMKALSTREADKNKDNYVSTDELREYVSDQVARASGDLQHPTVDRDNIYQMFGFGIK